jgi:hypothetical protein
MLVMCVSAARVVSSSSTPLIVALWCENWNTNDPSFQRLLSPSLRRWGMPLRFLRSQSGSTSSCSTLKPFSIFLTEYFAEFSPTLLLAFFFCFLHFLFCLSLSLLSHTLTLYQSALQQSHTLELAIVSLHPSSDRSHQLFLLWWCPHRSLVAVTESPFVWEWRYRAP